MGCSENCKCRPGVVALVFVPGIMGSRLQNKKTGDLVWDPAAGFGYEGPSSTAIQAKMDREEELKEAQTTDDDGFFGSIGKWFWRRKIGAQETYDNVKEKGRWVSRKASGVPTVTDYVFAGPASRKKMLVTAKSPGYDRDDNLLDVDPGTDQYFKTFTAVPTSQVKLKRSRGWGEILWDSYGPFLNYLEQKEKILNRLYPGLRFPVFAVGYNWMLSNEESGKRLKTKLAEFKQQILAQDERGISEQDVKFIIISHSMGGIASRAGMMLSGLAAEVEAAIHGAMPTDGSPDTYNRMRTGQAGASKIVLGKNAADMTAILGFCQGGLELLPNQLYKTADNKTEWLFYNTTKGKEADQRLPVSYGTAIFSFYKQFNLWYSLIQPHLLAPELKMREKTKEVLNDYIKAYINRMSNVEKFQQKLSNGFHPTTALIFSDNPAYPSHDRSRWLGKSAPDSHVNQWSSYDNENHAWFFGDGTVKLMGPAEEQRYEQQYKAWIDSISYDSQSLPPLPKTVDFTLGSPTAKGDGTVQEGAGKNPQAAGGLKKIPITASKDHQNIYNCPDIRDAVLLQLQTWLTDIHQKMGG